MVWVYILRVKFDNYELFEGLTSSLDFSVDKNVWSVFKISLKHNYNLKYKTMTIKDKNMKYLSHKEFKLKHFTTSSFKFDDDVFKVIYIY